MNRLTVTIIRSVLTVALLTCIQSVAFTQGNYRHITALDVDNPERFWFTDRPNVFNRSVSAAWDATRLIETDRPTFADSANTLQYGSSQFETGYTYRFRDDTTNTYIQNSGPESLLRLGVQDHFELRMQWQGYVGSTVIDDVTRAESNISGTSDFKLGFKAGLMEQRNWIPQQAVVGRFSVPVGATALSARTVDPGFSYLYQWQIRRWWTLRGSSGIDWLNHAGPVLASDGAGGNIIGTLVDPQDYQVQGQQAIASRFQLTQRLGAFSEYFVLFRSHSADNRPDHYHDYGLIVTLTPNIQLDSRVGWRLGGQAYEYFAGIGFAGRF